MIDNMISCKCSLSCFKNISLFMQCVKIHLGNKDHYFGYWWVENVMALKRDKTF